MAHLDDRFQRRIQRGRLVACSTRRMREFVARVVWPDATPHGDAATVVCHEWLAVLGGSDKVAAELADIASADVVYTFAVAADCLDALAIDAPVVTWRYGRWAGRSRRFTLLLPIMPVVWWALDLDRAHSVVTSSHSCVNAIRTPNAKRLSYCHTPMRYAWAWRIESGRLPAPVRPLMPLGAAIFRKLDRRWSRRVDKYVANSTFVAGRIRSAYGVDADVVPPPVVVQQFALPLSAPPSDAPFVTAGRWVAYKRFDLAVRAAIKAKVALVVAGGGPESARLRSIAGPTVTFVEDPTDSELAALLGAARAFLFCGVEDFGIVPVEAQASGTPVIARAEGGALDSVVPGVTGVLVDGDTVDLWAQALRTFDPLRFDRAAIRRHAEGFAPDRFRERIVAQLVALGDEPNTADTEQEPPT